MRQTFKTFRRRNHKDNDVAIQLQEYLEKHPYLTVTKTQYIAENLDCHTRNEYEKENLFVEFTEKEYKQTIADKTGTLIRDKVPEILKEKGIKFETDECLPELFMPFLRQKLEEEYNEFEYARTTEDVIDELVDMMEVIYAIAKEFGYSEQKLENMRLDKKEERGGFEKFLILDSIEKR